ncbi:MAG: hypothetical protein J1E97_08795, partial [Muribaculaceae bacterium]|nr:hypothetical protein [Muribaculaceae bacterium]
MKVVKKTGEMEQFNENKILQAIQKSADRINFKLSDKQKKAVIDHVKKSIDIRGCEEVLVRDLHSLVEGALMEIVPKVGSSYAEYRNYKTESLTLFNSIIGEEADLRLNGDKTNANTLSYLLPVKRSLTYKIYAKKMYQNFFLSINERKHIKEGLYYIHDIGDRQLAREGIINCCLADVGAVMKGGFELCGTKYAEPKTLATAVNVFMIVLNTMAASQYGGFTVESVDELFGYYAEKSYYNYLNDYFDVIGTTAKDATPAQAAAADEYAYKKTRKEAAQGIQNITYSLATSVSARGDFPFVTNTFGLGKGRFELMISEVILEDRIAGMGPAKIPAMFPKLVFLYDEELHGPGKPLEWLYEQALKCQSQTMLPDFLSL